MLLLLLLLISVGWDCVQEEFVGLQMIWVIVAHNFADLLLGLRINVFILLLVARPVHQQ